MFKLAVAGLALAGCYVQAPPASQSPPAAQSTTSSPAPEPSAEPTDPVGGEPAPAPEPGTAYELRYDWRAGEVHVFDYAEAVTTRVDMGMMQAAEISVDVASELELVVDEVDDDGWAYVTFRLRAFELAVGGSELVTLRAIPRRARSVRAAISPRGEIAFARELKVVMGEQRMHVVVAGDGEVDRSRAGVAATARVGDEEISVAATVDLETGTVTGAARHEKRARATDVTGDEPTFDVLPRDLLRLVVLPAGTIVAGQRTTVTTPFGDTTVTLREGEGDLFIDTEMQARVGGVQSLSASVQTQIRPQSDSAWLMSVEGYLEMATDTGGMAHTMRRAFHLARRDG